MRSFFLEGLSSAEAARGALRQILPGQENPWVLWAPAVPVEEARKRPLPFGIERSMLWTPPRDALGYFNVVEAVETEPYEDDIVCPAIFADLSGRHWDQSELIVATLEKLRALLGGRITDDGWVTAPRRPQ